jgi:hypothetical protein
MATPTLQFKRGLFVNLPSLRAGEPGITTDRSDLFVGGADGNKFYGSHRYWSREDGTAAAELKLVDAAGDVGVSLRSPATVTTPVTYTLPQGGGTSGYYLRLGSEGVLEWASVSDGASFDNATLSNTTFAGISTFGGLIEAEQGLEVSGGSTFDDINVIGVGTITTADINGGAIDGTVIGGDVAAEGTFTHLEYDSSSTTGISTVGELYVGSTQVLYEADSLITLAGIQTIDATTKATLEGILALDPNDFNSLNVAGISTIGGLLDANGGLDVSGHTKIGETLEVVGVSTFTGAINADGGVVGDLTGNVTGDLTGNVTGNVTGDLTGNVTGNVTGNLTGVASTATKLETARDFDIIGSFVTAAAVSFDGTGNVSLAATITENSIELGTYTTGNYVADVSGTANEVTVSGSGEGASLTLGLAAEVIVGTSLTAPTVYAGSVKAVDGSDAITISNTTGNVAFASTVTIEGDLQVLGSTTTVNTETLLIKDPVIELGRVDDNGNLVPPSSATATDLGLVFHYYDDAAKTSAFYWDHTTERFALAATLDNYPATTGSIVADAFAALELSSLYISDCAGSAQQVFGCENGEVTLLNTVIDCGSFDVE